jgi:cytochrome P450
VPGRLAFAFARNRIDFLQNAARRFGDVVSFSAGHTTFAFLNHPDYVRDVLVTRHRLFHKGLGLGRARMLLGDGLLPSVDERHRRQRRLMQPAVHRDRVAAYAGTMVRCAARCQERWRHGARMNVATEMAALTLAIAGYTLFDADVEREAHEIGDALNAAFASFNLAVLPFGDRLSRLPLTPGRRFQSARARLDAIIYRLIAERRAAGARGADLLSMLVAARDEEGDGTGMNDEQIRDEAVTLILAGHETTANALSWTWHLLSSHPAAAERFHAELDAVVGARLPSAEDVPRLPFTRAVLAEALRLLPPAYVLGRRAVAEYDVPGTPYVLPARTVVLVSQYLLHRDPRFWEAADRFDPDRWLTAEAGGARQRYAFFPFGAGPRICIGEHFAWMEGILVLATLGRRWAFESATAAEVPMQPIVTLRPRGGLAMIARRRPETA